MRINAKPLDAQKISRSSTRQGIAARSNAKAGECAIDNESNSLN
jgi:hypothetical protein